jgi:hypothetical protein
MGLGPNSRSNTDRADGGLIPALAWPRHNLNVEQAGNRLYPYALGPGRPDRSESLLLGWVVRVAAKGGHNFQMLWTILHYRPGHPLLWLR